MKNRLSRDEFVSVFGIKKCMSCGEILAPYFNGRRRDRDARFCDKSCHGRFLRINRISGNPKRGSWGWVKKYQSLPVEKKSAYLLPIKSKILKSIYGNTANTLGSKAENEFYRALQRTFINERIVHHELDVLKGYEFDFSFPDHRLLIEWNGPPHFDARYYNLKKDALLRRLSNDEYKHRKVKELGWKLITILDDSYYKNGNKLEDIFLNAIDRIAYYISKDLTLSEIYLSTAREYAKLATCNRLSVGAVIVRNGRIVSTGTNGSPAGEPHCRDVGCLLDSRGRCVRTVHAEENAILSCDSPTDETVLYCTDMPCTNCLKSIAGAGIAVVCYERDYDDGTNKILMNRLKKNISFFQYINGRFIKLD